MVVGSGALFGDLGNVAQRSPASLPLKRLRASGCESVFLPGRIPRTPKLPLTPVREAGSSLRTTGAMDENANARSFFAALSEKITLEESMAMARAERQR